MINSPKLLSLTLISFFLTPEDQKISIFDLPTGCVENICLFDELSLSVTCFTACLKMSCFKMSQIITEFEKASQIDGTIERCRSAKSDVCNYFSILDDEEKDELCADLKKWKELLGQIAILCHKYRKIDLPSEGDDFEKIKLSEAYEKMFNRVLSREERYYEEQMKLLKFHGVSLGSSSTKSNSTTSTMFMIPEGSDSDPDSD